MSTTPTTAMLLAAGLGSRMRPLTLTTPKPLIVVGGKPLIDWTLDPLIAAGINRAVVNVHYLPDQLRRHLSARPEAVVSDESDALLDTGGGVVKALPHLGKSPFFVCNCDGILTNATTAFARVAAAWNDDHHDVVMLVHPLKTAHGFDGRGDFFVAADGALRRRGLAVEAPYIYAGVYLMHPRVLAGETAIPFSMNRVWDKAIAAGRMSAVIHDGDWFHVGTPEAVAETNTLLAACMS